MHQYFPKSANKLFSSKGIDIIQEIGIDIITLMEGEFTTSIENYIANLLA